MYFDAAGHLPRGSTKGVTSFRILNFGSLRQDRRVYQNKQKRAFAP